MHDRRMNDGIACFEAPLPAGLIAELCAFWQAIFQHDYESLRHVLAGSEHRHNRHILYVAEKHARLAGTCHLTIAQANRELAGLGEICTALQFRRMGIATTLIMRAREDFRRAGGQALFLGTGNPDAARIYHRLGWRRLRRANVMAFIADGRLPEQFLQDWFKHSGATTIAPGSATERICMIPLILADHEWQVMDANVGIFSRRFVNQTSCMGLYPRYAALGRQGSGAWFAAHTRPGCVVGLSTARFRSSGGCQVDGFTHPGYPAAWPALLTASIDWAQARGADYCWVRASSQDEQKLSMFKTLGFSTVGQDEPFELTGREVASLRLRRDTQPRH